MPARLRSILDNRFAKAELKKKAAQETSSSEKHSVTEEDGLLPDADQSPITEIPPPNTNQDRGAGQSQGAAPDSGQSHSSNTENTNIVEDAKLQPWNEWLLRGWGALLQFMVMRSDNAKVNKVFSELQKLHPHLPALLALAVWDSCFGKPVRQNMLGIFLNDYSFMSQDPDYASLFFSGTITILRVSKNISPHIPMAHDYRLKFLNEILNKMKIVIDFGNQSQIISSLAFAQTLYRLYKLASGRAELGQTNFLLLGNVVDEYLSWALSSAVKEFYTWKNDVESEEIEDERFYLGVRLAAHVAAPAAIAYFAPQVALADLQSCAAQGVAYVVVEHVVPNIIPQNLAVAALESAGGLHLIPPATMKAIVAKFKNAERAFAEKRYDVVFDKLIEIEKRIERLAESATQEMRQDIFFLRGKAVFSKAYDENRYQDAFDFVIDKLDVIEKFSTQEKMHLIEMLYELATKRDLSRHDQVACIVLMKRLCGKQNDNLLPTASVESAGEDLLAPDSQLDAIIEFFRKIKALNVGITDTLFVAILRRDLTSATQRAGIDALLKALSAIYSHKGGEILKKNYLSEEVLARHLVKSRQSCQVVADVMIRLYGYSRDAWITNYFTPGNIKKLVKASASFGSGDKNHVKKLADCKKLSDDLLEFMIHHPEHIQWIVRQTASEERIKESSGKFFKYTQVFLETAASFKARFQDEVAEFEKVLPKNPTKITKQKKERLLQCVDSILAHWKAKLEKTKGEIGTFYDTDPSLSSDLRMELQGFFEQSIHKIKVTIGSLEIRPPTVGFFSRFWEQVCDDTPSPRYDVPVLRR